MQDASGPARDRSLGNSPITATSPSARRAADPEGTRGRCDAVARLSRRGPPRLRGGFGPAGEDGARGRDANAGGPVRCPGPGRCGGGNDPARGLRRRPDDDGSLPGGHPNDPRRGDAGGGRDRTEARRRLAPGDRDVGRGRGSRRPRDRAGQRARREAEPRRDHHGALQLRPSGPRRSFAFIGRPRGDSQRSTRSWPRRRPASSR